MNNTIAKKERALMLQNSYDKHVKSIDFNPTYIFNKISELPFNDCLVQYDSDRWIDITTFYDDNMTVIINVDLNDFFSCWCSIYHGKQTISRSESSLENIIRMLTLK